jgi:amino acid transporter
VIITLIAGFPVFLKGNWNTSDFIASYVGIPIFIVPIIAWKLWHKTEFRRAATMDLWSGRLREEDKPDVERPKGAAKKYLGWVW